MKTVFRTTLSALSLLAFIVLAGPTPSPPPDATATRRGLVNTEAQQFAGLKSFVDGGIVADLKPGSTFNGLQIVTTTVNDGGVLLNLLPGSTIGGQSFVASGGDSGLILQLMTGSTYNGLEFLTVVDGGYAMNIPEGYAPNVDGGYALNVDGGYMAINSLQTTAAVTLFVDPTGSDSNACTASGTSACLTVNGALAKLPRFINHNVIVNLAAGTFPPFTIGSFFIMPGVSLSIIGAALTTATVPSGTATGVVSSYDGGLFPARPSITDSTQSWPAKWSLGETFNMRGLYLTVTSDAGVSNTRLVVSADTKTLETLATFTPVPQPGYTYALQVPSSIVSGASTNVVTIDGTTGQVNFTNLLLTLTAGSNAILTVPASRPTSGLRLATSFVMFNDQNVVNSSVLLSAPDAIYSFVDTSFISGNNGLVISVSGANAQITLSRCYASAQRQILSCATTRTCSISSCKFDSRNLTPNVVVQGGPFNTLSTLFIECQARPESGSYYGGVNGYVNSALNSSTTAFNLSIDGCGNGITLTGGKFRMTSGTLEIKSSDISNYLASQGVPGGAIQLESGAFVDLHVASTLLLSNNGVDGGITYVVGPTGFGTPVNDTTLAAMPDGGQYFQNFHGTVFRR